MSLSKGKEGKDPQRERPLVVVAGGTGRQGGSICCALIERGNFRVRALTRSPNSLNAKRLAQLGVEIVECDWTKESTIHNALKGAWGVFGVTDHWDSHIQNDVKAGRGSNLEVEEGKRLGDCALRAGAEVFIWSSLDNTEAISGGRVKNPVFVNKWLVEQYIRTLDMKCAFVYPACYFSNFAFLFPVRTTPDGIVEFPFPLRADVATPFFDVADLGPFVAAMFENPDRYNRERVMVARQHCTIPEVVHEFTRVTGISARFDQRSLTDAAKDTPIDLIHMYQTFNEVGYYGGRDIAVSHRKFPELPWDRLKTFDEWLVASGWKGERLEGEAEQLSRLPLTKDGQLIRPSSSGGGGLSDPNSVKGSTSGVKTCKCPTDPPCECPRTSISSMKTCKCPTDPPCDCPRTTTSSGAMKPMMQHTRLQSSRA